MKKQYLARYKEPKSKQAKSSGVKHDTDVGTLTLGQYVNAKRKAKQNEIKEYEKQYLARYKEPKSKQAKSSGVKHDTDVGTLTLGQYVNAKRKAKQDEIKQYEKTVSCALQGTKIQAIKVIWCKNMILMSETLTLGQYVNAKRKAKQNEIKEYEQNSILRVTNNQNPSKQSHLV